jgi:hypothetical protein
VLGLFDTVNSVPRFENAMMSRHRIPASSALINIVACVNKLTMY